MYYYSALFDVLSSFKVECTNNNNKNNNNNNNVYLKKRL